jgi:hypothetical protein
MQYSEPTGQFSETNLEVMLLLLKVGDLLLVAVLHASHDAVRLLYSVHANSLWRLTETVSRE